MHPKNVIYVLCFLLFAVGCHTEKKGPKYQNQKILYGINTPDSIFNYPYDDGIWVTIKTTNQDKVASIIGLDTFTSANWAYGFKTSKNNNRKESSVFISPVINNNWILISGYNLPHSRLDDVAPFLNALSKEFGEAHYYLNHEKTYCIAKSKNGILERFARYHDIRDLIKKAKKLRLRNSLKWET